ncbi:MAG: UDP-N-acetylglucosamine 2-epimerase [Bacillota bacterium]
MRRVMVFSASRAEYGLLKPILRGITTSSRLKLDLVIGGAHLAPGHGCTKREIMNDALPITFCINGAQASDSPGAIVEFVGRGITEIAAYFAAQPPDIVVILGDRYELLIPLAGALVNRIPVAHLCGGETTEGALDEQVRHAATKMAHLHFPSTFQYARCLRRMGEEAWRINVVGAPGVENIIKEEMMTPEELDAAFGIDVTRRTLLITYHPETLTRDGDPEKEAAALTAALKEFLDYQQVITYPGMEVGCRGVIKAWESYVEKNPNARLYKSLGSRGYLGVMREAAAVVGNSSSGIIEAPSLKIPTVNIGDRQKGRVRAESVIDVPCIKAEIVAGLQKALYDAEFRRSLENVNNPYDPYGDGNVGGRVVSVLESVPLDRRLLEKKLDFPTEQELLNLP